MNMLPTRKFSIGIIDDHRLFAQALKELLVQVDFIEDVTICAPPREFGFQLPRKAFHLIFIDISMPNLDGFQVFKQIQRARPYQKMAFLSSSQNKLSIHHAKKLNARGYLLKSAGKESFRNAIATILLENKKSFPTIQRTAKSGFNHNGLYIKLSLREQKFLHLLIKELLLIEAMERENLNQPLSDVYKEDLLNSIIRDKLTREMTISRKAAQAFYNNLKEKFRANNVIELVESASALFK